MDQLKPPPTLQAPVTDDRGLITPVWADFLQSLYDEIRRLRTQVADHEERITDLEP